LLTKTNVSPTVFFELTPIASLNEASTISPMDRMPNNALIPMGRVMEGFHGSYTSSACEASELHLSLQIFLKNDVGDGENGIIFRNDGLLTVLNRLVGASSFCRNVDFYSTPNDTRPDFVGLWCNVQLIVCEEKENDISEAVSDIHDKFRFVQNYSSHIEYMFAFAISKNAFHILKLRRSPDHDRPESIETWFQSTLSTIADRMRCIIAALNVGRVFKYYVLSNLISAAQFPIGTWLTRQNGKSICLHYDYFIVEATQTKKRICELKKFYNDTYGRVPHMEQLYKKASSKLHPQGFGKERRPEELKIYLKPVGQVRKPRNRQEMKSMLLSILHCLKHLHGLEYLHCDIRWPNVICSHGSWYLIDCYDFCCMSDIPRRTSLKSARRALMLLSSSSLWEPADDICQLLALLEAPECSHPPFNDLPAYASEVAAGNMSVDDIIRLVNQIDVGEVAEV
jgi:hypothetical protein